MKKIIFVLIILFMASQVNAQQYLWRYRTDPTDCTSLTDGKERDLCFEEDDQTLYKCVPDSGNCSGTEWKLAGGASSVGALVDLTDVNSSTAGYGRLLVNNGTTWNSVGNTTIDPNTGALSIGGSNERVTGTTYGEYIDFSTDGYVGVYDGDTTNLMMIGSNVGIGTTTPGYKLEVTGDAYVSGDITCGGSCGGGASALADLSDVNSSTQGAGRLLVSDGGSWNSNNTMYVSPSGGNVGIGTSAPGGTLEVYQASPSANQALLLLSTSDSAQRFKVDEDGDVYNSGTFYPTYASFAGTVGRAFKVLDNIKADFGNDLDYYIEYFASGDYLAIFDDTTDTGLVVNGSGNVGIGNTGPGYKLEVTGDIYASGDITCGGTCGAGGGASELSDLSDVNTSTQGYGRIIVSNGTTWNSVPESTFYLDPNTGYVGLGTSAPTEKLTINGTISSTGAFSIKSGTGADNEDGKILVANGTEFKSFTMSGDTAIVGGGTVTIQANAIDSDSYIDASIDHEHLAPDVISGLTDVTSADADYMMIWDATDSALKKVDMAEVRGSGGASALADLSDVNTSTAGMGRILVNNGTNWNSINAITVNPNTGETLIGTSTVSQEMLTVDNNQAGDTEIESVNLNAGEGAGATISAKSANAQIKVRSYNDNNDTSPFLESKGVVQTDYAGNTDLVLTAPGTANIWMITNGVGAASSEVDLSILSNGNVGIGNTAPGYDLEVTGNIYASGDITCGGTCGAGGGASELSDLSDVNSSTQGAGRLLVSDGGSWNSNNTMYVSPSGGNVGIGTSVPIQKFDVVGSIGLENDEYIDNATNGSICLNGAGGTYNEDLCFDLESVSNVIGLSSNTGAMLAFKDDEYLGFGTGLDSRFAWETQGNDNLQLGLYVNNAAQSGYFSIMERGDLGAANRSPLALALDPTLRIYSSDAAVAGDYIEMSHNQTNGVIATGAGSLIFSPTSGNVGIGTTAPSTALQVAGTVTATAFSGPLTGNVTGNVSGSSGSTTGNAATATALAADPANCASSGFAGGINASGVAEACTTPNAGTDVTSDLEEETHASEHAVSAADTVFPADPDADRYLQWDDDPGTLVWAEVSGGAETNSLETTITGIADTEIFVGNGDNSGTFVAVSGDATLANTGALTVADDSHNHVVGNIDAAASSTWAGQITDEDGTGECAAGVFCMGGHTHAITSTLTIPFSIQNPDLLEVAAGRATRSQILWCNNTGSTFTVTKVYAGADTDDYTFLLFKSASLTDIGVANDTPIATLACSANGTSVYTDTETPSVTVENDKCIIFEHSSGTANMLGGYIYGTF